MDRNKERRIIIGWLVLKLIIKKNAFGGRYSMRRGFPVLMNLNRRGCGEACGSNFDCWGNRREGDHWGDLGVDGLIILGWISRRWDVGIWTGLGWPRIGTGGGRLQVR